MFSEFRRASLKIDLVHFDQHQKPLPFPFPGRLSIFATQTFTEKTQVVRASKQFAKGAEIVAQIFEHYRIDRTQNPQLIPKLFRFATEMMKILRFPRLFCTLQRSSSVLVRTLDRATKLFATKVLKRPAIDIGERAFQDRFRLRLPFRESGHEISQFEREHAFE